MARVTVEDCVLKIPNRFELVLVAAQRARNVSAGAPLTLARDDDKNPVIALREIADETVSIEALKDNLIQGLQKHHEVDEPEEGEGEFVIPHGGAEGGAEAAADLARGDALVIGGESPEGNEEAAPAEEDAGEGDGPEAV